MKNTNIKSIKRALAISTAAMIIGIIGILLELIIDKKWDSAGCSILACNAVIYCWYHDALKKASENNIE